MKLRVLVVLALILAACSPGDDNGSDTTVAESTPTTEAVVTTMAPEETTTQPEETTTSPPSSGGTVSVAETSLGEVLVDSNGRTLYIFTQDQGDVSVCYDACESTWPVVAAGAEAGDLDIELGATTRNDGSEQLTINGRPVYLYAADSGPGDVNGQAVGDVWFVIGVDGEPIGG